MIEEDTDALRSSLWDHPALTLSHYMKIVTLSEVESKWALKSTKKPLMRTIIKADKDQNVKA